MFSLSVLVILGLLWLGIRRQYLGAGSVVAGVLAGLVLASTPMGAPMATAVATSANAIGTSIKAGVNGLGK
jgi:hypothetical protein